MNWWPRSGFVFCFLSMLPPVPYCSLPTGEQQRPEQQTRTVVSLNPLKGALTFLSGRCVKAPEPLGRLPSRDMGGRKQKRAMAGIF